MLGLHRSFSSQLQTLGKLLHGVLEPLLFFPPEVSAMLLLFEESLVQTLLLQNSSANTCDLGVHQVGSHSVLHPCGTWHASFRWKSKDWPPALIAPAGSRILPRKRLLEVKQVGLQTPNLSQSHLCMQLSFFWLYCHRCSPSTWAGLHPWCLFCWTQLADLHFWFCSLRQTVLLLSWRAMIFWNHPVLQVCWVLLPLTWLLPPTWVLKARFRSWRKSMYHGACYPFIEWTCQWS